MAVIRPQQSAPGDFGDTGYATQPAPLNYPSLGKLITSDTPINAGGIAGAPAATQSNMPQPAPTEKATTPTAQKTTTRPATGRGPSSGVSSAADEALIRAKADDQVRQEEGGQAVKSPTALVLDYLTKQGVPRTGANVRAALEANARDRTTIPGLINQEPPAAEAQGGRGGGGGGTKSTAAPAAPATPPANNNAAVNPNAATAANLSDLVPQIARLILQNPSTGGGGGGGGGGVPGGPPNAPAPVAPQPAPSNPPLQGGATVVVPPTAPPANVTAEPVGRGPIEPSGRVIDVNPEGIAGPRNNLAIEPPADMPPLRNAIDRALRPAIGAPQTTPQAQIPATGAPKGTPKLEAPPISPENPVIKSPFFKGAERVGVRGLTGLRTAGPPGAAIGAGSAILEELLPYINKNLHLR